MHYRALQHWQSLCKNWIVFGRVFHKKSSVRTKIAVFKKLNWIVYLHEVFHLLQNTEPKSKSVRERGLKALWKFVMSLEKS